MSGLPPWIARQARALLAQRGHAWLLQGPSGLGHYTLALALARAWLCERPSAQGACGECGSCHAVAGISWPEGRVGARLEGLAERALIAGQVPNTPENMAAFIRNAPAHVPGTTMPAMPLTDARDIAAYLYQADD